MKPEKLLETIGAGATALLLLFAFGFFAGGLVYQVLCLFNLKATLATAIIEKVMEFSGYCAAFLFVGLMLALMFERAFVFVLKKLRMKTDKQLFDKNLLREMKR